MTAIENNVTGEEVEKIQVYNLDWHRRRGALASDQASLQYVAEIIDRCVVGILAQDLLRLY